MHGSSQVHEDVVRIAQQFRAAWLSGERPQLTDWMKRHPRLDRSGLLSELLKADLEMRAAGGEHPTLDEYISLFPGDVATIRDAFTFTDDETGRTVDASAETVTFSGASVEAGHLEGAFGDFELLERIGRGGMGVVYRARQVSLNRLVALKTIRAADVAETDEEVQRFRAEAEAAASLKHPGIVPVYQFGQAKGQWFLAMELVEGGSLGDLLLKGPLEPKRAATLLRQIAEAIVAAHAAGVVHRDLKPVNVLLDEHDQPRVTDFGLAKRTAIDSGMTATGQILGTPGYMPPEQARGEVDTVGPLADVYALGAMLYCLLTGRPPFQAANVMETLKQVLDREPVPPARLNPSVPADLETICLKCLEKDPSRRYDTAAALVDELSRFDRGEPILARPIGRPERAWRWCRRNPIVSSLVSAVLLLMLTLAIGGPLVAHQQQSLRHAADHQRQVAEDHRAESIRQERLALSNAALADAQARIAGIKAEEAANQARRAEAELRRAQWLLYAGKLTTAVQEIQLGRFNEGIATLESTRLDMRGWEFDYLHTCARSRTREFSGLPSELAGPVVAARSHSGRLSAYAHGQSIQMLEQKQHGPSRRTLSDDENTTCLTFAVDDSCLVSGNAAGELITWPVAGRSPLSSIEVFDAPVKLVAAPQQEPIVAAVSRDSSELVLISLDTASPVARTGLPDKSLTALSFHGKERTLRGLTESGQLITWTVPGLQQTAVSPVMTGPVSVAAFNQDATAVAGASLDGTVIVAGTDGTPARPLTMRHSRPIQSLTFASNGRLVASLSESGILLARTTSDGPVTGSRDNDVAAVIDGGPSGSDLLVRTDGRCDWYSLADRRRLQSAFGPDRDWKKPGMHSSNGQVEVSFGSDGRVSTRRFDSRAARRSQLASRKLHSRVIRDAAVSPDGRLVCSAGTEGIVAITSSQLSENDPVIRIDCESPHVVTFLQDSRLLLIGNWDGELLLCDSETGEELSRTSAHSLRVSAIVIDHRTDTILSAGDDGLVRLWKCNGRLLNPFGASIRVGSPVTDAIFLGGTDRIATLSGGVSVWSTAHGVRLLQMGDPPGLPRTIGFDAVDNVLYVTGNGAPTTAWLAEIDHHVLSLRVDTHAVTGVALSNTGRRLLTATSSRNLALWDAASGERIGANVDEQSLRLTESLHDLRWLPDGDRVIAYGDETSLFDIDLHERKLHRTAAHDVQIQGIDLHRETSTLASLDRAGTLRLWDVTVRPPALRREIQLDTRTTSYSNPVFADDENQLLLISNADGSARHVNFTDRTVTKWRTPFAIRRMHTGQTGGRKIACIASGDGQLAVVDLGDRTLLTKTRMPPRCGHLHDLRVADDGKNVAVAVSAVNDGRPEAIAVFTLPDLLPVMHAADRGRNWWRATWSPDSRSFARNSGGGRVEIWRIRDQEHERALE